MAAGHGCSPAEPGMHSPRIARHKSQGTWAAWHAALPNPEAATAHRVYSWRVPHLPPTASFSLPAMWRMESTDGLASALATTSGSRGAWGCVSGFCSDRQCTWHAQVKSCSYVSVTLPTSHWNVKPYSMAKQPTSNHMLLGSVETVNGSWPKSGYPLQYVKHCNRLLSTECTSMLYPVHSKISPSGQI